jgi:hypothetical protein
MGRHLSGRSRVLRSELEKEIERYGEEL